MLKLLYNFNITIIINGCFKKKRLHKNFRLL